jgi:protein arginine kinase activator
MSMKCQSCSNPATVHLTTLAGLKKKEVHLCAACAKQQQVMGAAKPELNIHAIVHFMLGSQLGPEAEKLAQLTCPHCGMGYMQFRQEGRLGCPHDYETFQSGLEPILKRIHRATRHLGKTPPNHKRNLGQQVELYELHRRLREAVDGEAFEEAANLRDLIRQKEISE